MHIKLISMRTLGSACGLALAITCLAAAQQGQQLEGKTAEQAYKNIQVLNGTPAELLGPTMRVIARDLDVSCEFCHDEKDRSKDELETKTTARMMIKMMMDINKNSFGGKTQVTCFTCHNGHADPANVPVLPAYSVAVLGPGDDMKPPALPSIDQILANYVKAVGGEQNIRKVNTLVITGTRQNYTPAADTVPPAFPVEYYRKAPNMAVVLAHAANGVAGNGFDGKAAWTQDARGRVTQMSGIAADQAKREADFYPALDMKQQYQTLTVMGIEKIGDRSTYVVAAYPQGPGTDHFYFDTQTGLLVRKLTVLPSDLGNAPMAIDYEDYRDAGNGFKMPYVMHIVGPSRPDCATITVSKIEENVPLDNSKFAKPEPKTP